MDQQTALRNIDRVIANGPFSADWDSLSAYEAPAWYRNLKFGIFTHWGLYSIPAFANEWYSRNMYIQGTPEFEHHVKTFGPQNQFGYKDFIPLFKAERFDPDAWAELFASAGAQYIVPVAEHHDGFQMYKSELSHWNAAEMGPKRDILGELAAAYRKRGLVVGASSHRVEHWFFMGHGREFDSDVREPMQLGDFYWPAAKEQNHQDILSVPAPTDEFLTDWLLRCCELVDRYQPRIVYFDWWIQHSAVKPYLKKFAAYYYNRAAEWGTSAVINYKHDAFAFGCAVPDMERGQFADVKPFAWQSDTAIAKNSWCYTENNDYKSAASILCDLADIVSKNGRLLLNVGPKADGSFGEEDLAVLHAIGDWMRVNGEAIYDTQIWRTASEGNTKIAEGQFTDSVDKVFTPEDIRFTCKGSAVYAIVLRWPEDGVVRVRSLAEGDPEHLPVYHGLVKDVRVLGFDDQPRWERTHDALVVHGPAIETDSPVVLRCTVD